MVGKWYTLGLANSGKGVVLQCSTAGKLELLASHFRLNFWVDLSGFTHTLEPLTNCGLFASESLAPGFGFMVTWPEYRYFACEGTKRQDFGEQVLSVALFCAGHVWKRGSDTASKDLFFIPRVQSDAA